MPVSGGVTRERPTLRPRLPLVCGGRRARPRTGRLLVPSGYEVFFARVAPPRPRSVTPDSLRTRCTKPYDRPVDSARARMLAPFSYFFFRSLASLSRWVPVIRAPFFRSATTNGPPPLPHTGPSRGRSVRASCDIGAGPPLRGTMIVDARTAGHQCGCGSVNGSPERITQSGDQWNLGRSGTSRELDELQIVGRPVVLGPVGQHDDLVRRQGLDRSRIVGDEHDGAGEVPQRVEHLLTARRVQVVRGLVEQQHVRGARHQPGQRE